MRIAQLLTELASDEALSFAKAEGFIRIQAIRGSQMRQYDVEASRLADLAQGAWAQVEHEMTEMIRELRREEAS